MSRSADRFESENGEVVIERRDGVWEINVADDCPGMVKFVEIGEGEEVNETSVPRKQLEENSAYRRAVLYALGEGHTSILTATRRAEYLVNDPSFIQSLSPPPTP